MKLGAWQLAPTEPNASRLWEQYTFSTREIVQEVQQNFPASNVVEVSLIKKLWSHDLFSPFRDLRASWNIPSKWMVLALSMQVPSMAVERNFVVEDLAELAWPA